MRLVRIAAAVLGGLLVLVVAALIAVAWLLDPNDYKDRLAAEFERRTGRTLVISRDLALDYLPWLAVETGGLVVGNAPGFSERDFARVERLAARIRLLPLISGDLRVGTIVLEGLEVNLETDSQGRGNWMLAGAGKSSSGDGAAADADADPLARLDLDGLRLRDGTVTWRELGTGREVAVGDIELTAGGYRPGEPVDVEAAFRITDSATGVAATVATEAALERTQTGLTLRGWRSELEVAKPGAFAAGGEARLESLEWRADGPLTLTGGGLMGWLEAPGLGEARRDVAASWLGAELDPGTGALAVDELTTSVDRIAAYWRLSRVSLLDAPARVEGEATVPPTPMAALLRAFPVVPPARVDGGTLGDFELSARFALGLDPLALELPDFEARGLGAAVTGRATVTGGPRFTVALEIPAFAPGAALRALLAPHVPEGVALEAFESIALAVRLEADPSRGTLALDDLHAGLLGATLTGRAGVRFAGDAFSTEGRLASTPIDARTFEAAFGALLTDTVDPGELGMLKFDTGFRYERAADRLVLDPLALDAFGLSATGALTANALSASPFYTGRARVEPFAPRALMRRFGQLPPRTSDPAALGTASIETSFEIRPERGVFRDLVVGLDGSRVTGEFTVEDFANPAYRFALAADRLDADRYMAPPSDETEAGERAAGDLRLDGAGLDNLDLSGRVEIGSLEVAGLAFADVATRIEVGRGAFRLDEAGARLYGGRFDGAFAVEASGEVPTMALTGRAEGVDLAPLITDLAGQAHFSGRGDFDLSLAGSGLTVTDNVRNASGTMGFTIRDGAIEGFDLGRTLCATYNRTRRLPEPPEPDVDRTRYGLLSGTADVAGGVATSRDLLARAAFMDVTGAGSIDLVEQALDYELEAKLTAPIEIPRCESMDGLVGESIPLTLGGTLDAPRILPDFGEILKRRVQDAVRDRATERLEERLKDRLRDIF